MAPLAEAFIRIRAQYSGFRREVNREFGGAGREASREFERNFNNQEFFRRVSREYSRQMGGGDWGRSGQEAFRSFERHFSNSEVFRRMAQEYSRQMGGSEWSRSGREAGQEFQQGVNRSTGNTRIRIDADVSGALASLGTLSLAIAALPVATQLAAGVAALAPAFLAAGVGAGALAAVAVPAFSRIGEALEAQKAAQKAAAAAGSQAASKALAQAGAQAALASAVRNSGFAHKQALDQVRQSEQQLTSSQQAAVAAQRALTSARGDARRQLQDMANQVASAQLSVRQSTFDTADAQAEYNRVLADPKATADQKARAKLTVDQARQSLKEQQLMLKRLQADEKRAAKAGVEGSDQVRQARERLTQANQQVANSERALSNARAGVARADAQSAEAVANARRALTAANLQGANGNAALNAAMAALSPSARKLMGDWEGLTGAFDKWQRSMEPTVLPLFSRGIGLLRREIPSLTPIVKGATGAVDGLLDGVERGAKGDRWASFKKNLTKLVPIAITSLGKSTGNVISGIGGIFEAFMPRAPKVLKFVERLTQKFDEWGTGLGTSPGFQKLMTWIDDNGPQVSAYVTEIANAFAYTAQSLAPVAGTLGMGALGILGAVAKVVNSLSPEQIRAIAIALVAIRVTMVAIRVVTLAWAAAQAVLNGALIANPIGLIVIGIAALVAGFVLAYNKVTWFRTGVQAAWAGIQVASQWAWNNVLKPIFAAIGWYITTIVIPYYKLLWNIAKLVWSGISTAAKFAWNYGIKPYFNLIKWYIINVVVAYFKFLWNSAKTIFTGLKTVVMGAWNNGIKPAFDKIRSGVSAVRNAFSTGIGAIGKSWDRMRGLTKTPVNFVIGTVYNKGIRTLWNKVMGWLHLPKSMQLGQVPLLAKGGSLDNPAAASPMMTNGPMAIVGEGRKQYPEYVIPTDPRHRGRAQALWSAAGGDLQMLARGGVLGDVLGGVKKVAGKVVSLGKGALDLITNPKKVWDRLVADYVPSASHLGNTTWGKAIASTPKAMLSQVWGAASQVIKAFDSGRNGDASGVVAAAARYIGQGDDRGRDNDNRFTRGYGWPAGTPWCALFASKAIEDARAKSRYPGTPTAAVAQFNARMRHVPTAQGRPGDLATYGSNDHVNVIARRFGSGRLYETIGGNEGPRVKRSRRGGQATVLRPLAAGGLLGEVFGQRNLDPRDRSAPLTRALASMAPLFDTGGMLPPGPFNHRRKPEPVLTDRQWDDMHTLAQRGTRSGPVVGELHLHGLPGIPSDQQVSSAIDRTLAMYGDW